ncbi:MAG: glycosyltransferase family 4 protein [Desulfobacterales bacterium]
MDIVFYTPFKPLGHPDPSGDAVTAEGLREFLAERGHRLFPASDLRCRWIFWKPWLWPRAAAERRRLRRRLARGPCDLWFSYHSYYKAPDVLGPAVARALAMPYVLFQGIFSTKRRRSLRTLPGYLLNRRALLAARQVFTNKRVDLRNLRRLLPAGRVTYIAPGIRARDFGFRAEDRARVRQAWAVGETPVVLAVAMCRRGVKAEGLARVIRACGALLREGQALQLVVAGDGPERPRLERLAAAETPGAARFLGRVPRPELPACYSAADLFAFPGIREALGLVFLEAQSCGLPVVAFDNAGTPEAVRHGETGVLVPLGDDAAFAREIGRLLRDPGLRRRLGRNAAAWIRRERDLEKNYALLEETLQAIAAGRPRRAA